VAFQRSSGVLLHVTSLPGPYGIGDLGSAATAWVDWVAQAGCRYWQLLPLGPTGYADSPYASFSSFAGNPYLVSPDLLVADGLLEPDDIGTPGFGSAAVDYGQIIPWKIKLLDVAYTRLSGSLHTEFVAFRNDEADWLDDFSLFMAIKEDGGNGPWADWPAELRHRDEDTLNAARERLASAVERHAFRQFIFFRQWQGVREHAAAQGVEIIGDIPLYAAHDSADVWAHPELFAIDPETSRPTLVAGVPPDMFSDTGQLWGNPLYHWATHAADGYAWWVDRLAAAFRQVDVLRIDHFTGFARYYAVPGADTTAEHGVWHDGPGAAVFEAAHRSLGDLAIIAEDLGPLGEEVEELRRRLGFPGMKVLQEAFDGDPANMFHPDNYAEDFIVYTGTHDSDTSRGRFDTADDVYRRRVLEYTGDTADTYPWGLVEAAWASVAEIAVAPMQDLLGLGTEARMNFPSTIGGNWQWRMAEGAATPELAARLASLNERTGR
jgi:4-alpha-glucanotransferase